MVDLTRRFLRRNWPICDSQIIYSELGFDYSGPGMKLFWFADSTSSGDFIFFYSPSVFLPARGNARRLGVVICDRYEIIPITH